MLRPMSGPEAPPPTFTTSGPGAGAPQAPPPTFTTTGPGAGAPTSH